jgi:MFS family permease
MAIAFILAGLTLSGLITIHALIVISVLQGLVNAFDMPCRQAFVVSVIEDKNDLGNAIALNSSMFNGARLIGPSVAATIIATWNEGWCFFIDGVSFFAVILALLAMRITDARRVRRAHETVWHQFKEGWTYAFGFSPVRSIIVLLGIVSLLGIPYGVLMPIVAGDILHGGPRTFGLLMTATGAGALFGALWLASRRTIAGLGRNIPVAGAIFSCGLIAFAFSTTLWVSALLLVVASFGFMVQVASSNTLLQTIVDDSKRGRVMSFFLMAYFGTTPFGSLAAGAVSARIGAPYTLALGGALCLVGVAWFTTQLRALHDEIEPIFTRLGAVHPAAGSGG